MPATVAQAYALVDRAKDAHALVETLTQDVVEIGYAIRSPATARSYVRTVFAYVEGSISVMSTNLLEGQEVWGWSLSEEEARVLWDAVRDPSTPRPDASSGRATLTERLKTTMKVGHRLFGDPCAPNFGGRGFQAFRSALHIRDRLMHPKVKRDLDLSIPELETIDPARDWFREESHAFFVAFLAYGKEQIESVLAAQRGAEPSAPRRTRDPGSPRRSG